MMQLLFVIAALAATIHITPGSAAGQPTAPPAAPAASASALQTPHFTSLDTAVVERGEWVNLTGSWPTALKVQGVELSLFHSGNVAKKVLFRMLEEGKTLTFYVPRDLRHGYYSVDVLFPNERVRVGRLLHVDIKQPVSVSAIEPLTRYPTDVGPMAIRGGGFGPLVEDLTIFVGERRYPSCGDPKEADKGTCLNIRFIDDGTLTVEGRALGEFRGRQPVRVAIGERFSAPTTVSFARVSKSTPKLIALAVLLIVFFLVWLTLKSLQEHPRTAALGGTPVSKPMRLLQRVFLDQETNTYSLSKLQFFLWTAAAVFGYAYLSAARSMVQGDFTLSDTPKRLGMILAIAVGTPAATTLISATRGSKGSGYEWPRWSDFLTTGGVVAPDRLQFFVWTIVGVIAFVGTTLAISPADIFALPDIPEGFLTLMGISSAGYLAGKLARAPGPNITRIEATVGSQVLRVEGTKLSLDATFMIDGETVESKLLDPDKHGAELRPIANTPEDASKFTTSLTLHIKEPNPSWITADDHKFTIVNPDGQMATGSFKNGAPAGQGSGAPVLPVPPNPAPVAQGVPAAPRETVG